MSTYQVVVHHPSQELLLSGAFRFERYLFNEPVHLASQPGENVYTFYLVNHLHNRVEARFSLFLEELLGKSPSRAPFGAIECNPKLRFEYLSYFLTEIHRFAAQKGVRALRLTNYPFCYAPESAQMLTALLLENGYTICNTELNQHITIAEEAFEKHLHPSERRRLRKCVQAEFVFEEALQPDLAQVYAFVKECRLRRCFPISMDWVSFEKLFFDLKPFCKVFWVKDHDQITALTVVILVNGRIMYNFYPADHASYRNYSPVVMLTKGLFDYGQQNGFQLLDMGISTDKGEPNYGLIRFKQNLGAETSLKLSFEKVF